jgi:mRNA interferase HigB
VRIIAKKAISLFGEKHFDALSPLLRWYSIVEDGEWRNYSELRTAFPSADQVRVASGRIATVFNIAGNKYRLISAIHYNRQTVFIMRIFSHQDYDNIDWKSHL